MSQMENVNKNIELSDPVDSFSLSSIVNPDCSDVGVSCDPDSVWIPSTGNFFCFFSQFKLVTVSHSFFLIYWSLLDFIFKTFDLSEIHGMLTAILVYVAVFDMLLINITIVNQVVVCFQTCSRK